SLLAAGTTTATASTLLPSASQPSASPEIDERQVLGYLASDELEGRGIGSKGLDRAADYIVEQFTRAGLQVAPGMNGLFQPFEMTTSTSIGDQTSLRSGEHVYKPRDEFTPLGFSAEGEFAGPIVFVGYGITSDANHYDDYANIDVKGKIALAMRFEPHDDKGRSRFEKDGWSDDAALTAKAKAAKDHGAAALIVFTPTDFRAEDRLMP